MVETVLVGGGLALVLVAVPFLKYPRKTMALRKPLDPVSIYESGGTSDLLAAYTLALLLGFLGLFMIYRGLTV